MCGIREINRFTFRLKIIQDIPYTLRFLNIHSYYLYFCSFCTVCISLQCLSHERAVILTSQYCCGVFKHIIHICHFKSSDFIIFIAICNKEACELVACVAFMCISVEVCCVRTFSHLIANSQWHNPLTGFTHGFIYFPLLVVVTQSFIFGQPCHIMCLIWKQTECS